LQKHVVIWTCFVIFQRNYVHLNPYVSPKTTWFEELFTKNVLMAHTFDGELNYFLVTYSSTIAMLTRPCATIPKKINAKN
jgi:hypothetical protein